MRKAFRALALTGAATICLIVAFLLLSNLFPNALAQASQWISALGQIADVSVTNNIPNGNALIWNSTLSKWTNGTLTATGTNQALGVNATQVSTANLQDSTNLLWRLVSGTNAQAVLTNVSPTQLTGVIPTNQLASTIVNADRATTFTANQTVQGSLAVTNAITAATLTASNSVTGATIGATTSMATPTITANNVTATNAVTGATLGATTSLATPTITANNVTATNAITGATIGATTSVSTPTVTANNITATNAITAAIIGATTSLNSPIGTFNALTATNSIVVGAGADRVYAIAAGSNVTLSTNGNVVSIASSGGGGGGGGSNTVSFNGTFDSTPNFRDGAGTGTVPPVTWTATGVTNHDLTIGPASGSVAGAVTTGTQTIAGAKTFSTSVTSPTVGATTSAATPTLTANDITATNSITSVGTSTLTTLKATTFTANAATVTNGLTAATVGATTSMNTPTITANAVTVTNGLTAATVGGTTSVSSPTFNANNVNVTNNVEWAQLVGDKIVLYRMTADTNNYGFGIASSQLLGYVPTNTATIKMGFGNSTNFSGWFTLGSSGLFVNALTVTNAVTATTIGGTTSISTPTMTAGALTVTNGATLNSATWNKSRPNILNLGTIANHGTATLVSTTNVYRLTASGADAGMALFSGSDGDWAEVFIVNSSGGSQIWTNYLSGTAVNLEFPWGTSATFTNATGGSAHVVYYYSNAVPFRAEISGDAYSPASGGSGTVTATGGSLTANSVVLGAGTTDTKVVAGIITDGTSKVTLGVAGSSVGSVDFKNATSGTITLTPTNGALGTTTITLPSQTGTVALQSQLPIINASAATAYPLNFSNGEIVINLLNTNATFALGNSAGGTNLQLTGTVLKNQTTNNGAIRHTLTSPAYTTTNILWDLSAGNVQYLTLTNAAAGLLYFTGFTNSTVQNGTWLLYLKQDSSGSRTAIITNSATTIGHASQSITTYTNANGISLITLVGNPFTNGSYFFTLSTNL